MSSYNINPNSYFYGMPPDFSRSDPYYVNRMRYLNMMRQMHLMDPRSQPYPYNPYGPVEYPPPSMYPNMYPDNYMSEMYAPMPRPPMNYHQKMQYPEQINQRVPQQTKLEKQPVLIDLCQQSRQQNIPQAPSQKQLIIEQQKNVRPIRENKNKALEKKEEVKKLIEEQKHPKYTPDRSKSKVDVFKVQKTKQIKKKPPVQQKEKQRPKEKEKKPTIIKTTNSTSNKEKRQPRPKIQQKAPKELSKYQDSHGKIRIGKDFQCVIPEFIIDKVELLMWKEEKKRSLLTREIQSTVTL